jgi:DNA invertase Pin-like site-specific DNA recombinase
MDFQYIKVEYRDNTFNIDSSDEETKSNDDNSDFSDDETKSDDDNLWETIDNIFKLNIEYNNNIKEEDIKKIDIKEEDIKKKDIKKKDIEVEEIKKKDIEVEEIKKKDIEVEEIEVIDITKEDEIKKENICTSKKRRNTEINDEETIDPKKLKKITNVIIYCRISSSNQVLDAQEHSCVSYCKQNNFNVISTVNEITSAYSIKKLRKINHIINNNKNITIVIYSIDRFSRNLTDANIILDMIIKNNINVIAVKDNIDLSTPNGRHEFRVKVSLAQLESEKISERVKTNNQYKLDKGYYIGTAPYGYKIADNKKIKYNKEQMVIRFITDNLYTNKTSIEFSNNLFNLLKIYDKPSEDFIKIDFYIDDNISEETMYITTTIISDILNEYDILKRKKLWNNNKVLYIYNKYNISNNDLEILD